jgi:hypothetical protein
MYIIFSVRIDHPVVAKLRDELGGRPRRIRMCDANAQRQKVSIAANAAYTIRVAVKVRDRRIDVWVGQELACISLAGDFDVPLFTLNAPDRIGFRSAMAGSVRIGLEKLPVFTQDGRVAAVQKNILDSREVRTLVAFHPFRKGEAIHFYRNGMTLYARNEDVTSELIDMIIAVADVVPICGTFAKKHR